MQLNKAHTSILLFLVWICSISAQAPELYRFESLPQEIGFANTGVNDILEDHEGFLWLATWSGIAKYDGYTAKMYRQMPDNSNGLKSNKVTQVYEDSGENLWIATNYSGFYRYDREQDVFIQYCNDPEDQNSLSDDNVLAICEDRNGMLWIGTERGLNRFNPESGQFIVFENDPRDSRSLSHNFVYSIAETPDGSLWVGTEEGLNRMVSRHGQTYFIHYELMPEGAPEEEYLSHNFIFKIIPSAYDDSKIWICTSNGLKELFYSPEDLEAYSFTYYGHSANQPGSLSHPFIPDILEEDEARIWVATYNGLDLLDLETGESAHFKPDRTDPQSISSNVVMCLAKDRTNNLWIGYDRSINKLNLNAKAFRNILPNPQTGNNVMCMIPSGKREGIWVGTRGGGLCFLPEGVDGSFKGPGQNYTFRTDRFPEQVDFIFSLMIDREGWLWLATDGAGIVRIRESDIPGKSARLSSFEQFNRSSQISGDYVVSMIQSVENDVWIGYWDKGLDRYDPETGTFEQYVFTSDRSVNFQEFPIVHLHELIEDGQPYLLLGTRGGGIYKLKYDRDRNVLDLVTHYNAQGNDEGRLSNNFVNCFMLDHQNRLWAGTDNGLNVLDPRTGICTRYFERDGLKHSIIQSILEDRDHKIWLSTQEGISSLQMDGQKGLQVRNFDAYDGLQDNFFNDDAAIMTDEGYLVFGGVNGLSVFKPGDIHMDSIPPKVAITDFRLFNKSVPIGNMENGRTILSKNITETESIVLSHRDNVISIEYTGLHFNEPRKLQYAHQLAGFDPEWVYTDASQRIAHYTNLPYEEYIFRVKASNGDGVWSEVREIAICVRPPFWLSGWAFLVYGLAIAVLAYLGFRLIKMRAEFRHSLELERVEREKLEEVNKMKLQFFTNISHELRTPLTLIISPLEQLLQSEKDRKLHRLYTRMHYNANRLFTMINQLLDIRKSEAGLMNLHVAKGNIVDFTKEVTASFQNMAKQRKIRLKFSSDAEAIEAWFDHDEMEKVLFNLISNAFKFTRDKGKIHVHVSQPGPVRISISDTGIGIPADQLPNIFERFYQVEEGEEWVRKSGTGIGLSLAKTIMEKHHGSIDVESEEGVGTTFRINLPVGKDHFTSQELSPGEKVVSSLPAYNMLRPVEAETADKTETTTANGKGQPSKPLILLVEDNPDVRAYLRENLETDYRISEAADGKEGLDKALADPPDLIIADIAMPRMDGIEMTRHVKTNIDTSHVPVILLTARTSLVFKVDGLETGADDYVTKPFHMRLLLARVKNLIASRQSLKEHFAKSYDLSPSGVVLNSLDEQLLSQMKTVIERHIDDSDFSVDQLAKALNMSRAKQYRKIKSLTGQSPNQVIRGFRLKRAAQLIETGQYNISDVAYMIGYNDVKSFREQFRKEFGVNPSEFELHE